MAAARSKRTTLAGLGAAKRRLDVERDRGAPGPSPRHGTHQSTTLMGTPRRRIGTLRSGSSMGTRCTDSGRCSRLLRNRSAAPGPIEAALLRELMPGRLG